MVAKVSAVDSGSGVSVDVIGDSAVRRSVVAWGSVVVVVALVYSPKSGNT